MANSIDLVMRLLADDRASAAFKKAGAAVDETGGKYSKFAKTAAASLAAIGVVKFAKDSVKAYSDAEQSQAKLTLAYKKFPKTANLSIESLRAYNSELQRKTKYDDDDTAAMQAHLAMFDLTGQQIKDLTPLVQDLASAQGVDLATASDAVGKALMGNTRGLKAIGVQFKATGDKAKDYATLQALLNKQVGGFAENEGKTAAGQAAILANQWGDLQETVGAALVPALTSLVNVAKPVLEAFNGMPEPVKQTTIVVAALGAGFVMLAPKVAAARAALIEFGTAKAGATGEAAADAGRFGRILGGVGKALPVIGTALGVGAVALELFGTNSSLAAESQKAFKAALDASNGALDDNVRKTVAKSAEDAGLLAQARKLGIAEADVVDAIMGDAAAKQRVATATREAMGETKNYEAAARHGAAAMSASAQTAIDFQGKMRDLTGGLKDAASSQSRLNSALDNTDAKAQAVSTSWARLRAAMKQPINGAIRISVRANGDVAVNSGTGGGRAVVDTGRAAGGYLRAGQVSRVGEFGPELFVAPTSGRIVPNSATRAAGGSADMAQVVVMLDGKQVQTSLVTLKRRQGGNLAFQ